MAISNMGDMGDMGDIGNTGASSANGMTGGTVVLPGRVEFPFSTEPAQTGAIVAGNWTWTPVAATPTLANLPLVPILQFPDHEWDANWLAWPILGEFASTNWATRITFNPWDNTAAAIEGEINQLLRASTDERADALGEIVAQNASYEDIMAYFMGLMRITSKSHPHVFRLLHVAGLVGLLTAMYFKANPGPGLLPRARPSQLCPALLPAVEVPGHPSFPSGHATQSMLMALCILGTLPPAQSNIWRPALQTLSWRIARNREIAGLHYPSDKKAGFEIASQSYDILMSLGSFIALNTSAQGDWP